MDPEKSPPREVDPKDEDKAGVVADLLLRPAAGKSVGKTSRRVTPENVKEFLPSPETLETGARELKRVGFRIEQIAATHLTVSGPPGLFEQVFEVRLYEDHTPILHPPSQETQSFYRPEGDPRIPPQFADWLESIHFAVPPVFFVDATPPSLPYDHMQVPHDVARDMDALKCHQRGITGAGVRLAMVDSGFMTPLHPYYPPHGYNIQPVSSAADDPAPGSDDYGHGTAIASCALAVAPGVTFLPVKTKPSATAAFSRAVELEPDIITNSWGLAYFGAPIFSAPLQLAINNAVADGIVVCFSCGNGGWPGWPGTEPAVISVGGVYVGPDDTLSAADYAASGTLSFNPARQVPDLCGITGEMPKGILIAEPTQPESTVDDSFAGGTFPDGDQTADDDGWVVASGTSSACPMVAGVAALAMEKTPALKGNPVAVRLALNTSCIDVTSGMSGAGEGAGPGQDLATGLGLVQAYRALFPADVWMRTNPDSDIGWGPVHNARPSWPPYAHWRSADVKVVSSPLANPVADFDSAPFEQPIFGEPSYVYVRARNRGPQGSGAVTAKLYYADPSTNLVFPADWRDGQSGVPGEGSLEVDGVGTHEQTVADIAAGASVVMPKPYVWNPPDPTLATQLQDLPDGRKKGHFCLLVRLENALDPIHFTGGTQNSVVWDNNLGMRNVSVFSGPAARGFKVHFWVRGMADDSERTRYDILADLRAVPRRARVDLCIDSEGVEQGKPVAAKWVDRRCLRLYPGPKPAGLRAFSLKYDEKALARLVIELPPDTQPGEIAVPILQQADGHAAGGLTFVASVTPP